ncbi:lipolytic protein G-D-S-L family [Stanieria cyanosphaera PCC 7437]|uniref:Lipolytic protein G-D-S-L family n=1 Tax=Stanieria cyanosphaera (strain ATCC 29371 / PCC 7437) TaxID=111780 RepID=K9XU50_STAC7|nr:SGNH/GDSL hydrolase family protein [Stanieria cyanosphaera]AFZ35601.1 lipolytic protein G-D-S-L family [Stanieria cyanosphaera PCC 7437]
MKLFLIILASVTGIVILVESGLRLLWGLGNPPLYIPDEEIGYLLKPNQKLRRMGNQILINQYSMRNEAIASDKPATTFRVMLLGDSIVNGGWWTDQDETLSTLLERQIETNLAQNRTVEVLNVSANSWSPRNQLAYLQRFGLFEADILILVINTDDLFGILPTPLPVGREKNYPDQKPPLALIELYNQKFGKNQSIPEFEKIKQESGDRVGKILTAIKEIKILATEQNTQFIVAMTPLLRETKEKEQRDYEKEARKRLQDFAKTENLIYLDFLPIFQDFPQPEFLYRDHIHLSPQGNALVTEKLSQFVQEKL